MTPTPKHSKDFTIIKDKILNCNNADQLKSHRELTFRYAKTNPDGQELISLYMRQLEVYEPTSDFQIDSIHEPIYRLK